MNAPGAVSAATCAASGIGRPRGRVETCGSEWGEWPTGGPVAGCSSAPASACLASAWNVLHPRSATIAAGLRILDMLDVMD